MPRSTGYLKKFLKNNIRILLFLLLLCAAAVIITVVTLRNTQSEREKREELYPLISEYAEKYQLDKELVYAVIECESGFDVNAVSRAGACGLMQLMPNTFLWITETEEGELDIFDPETNIQAGCKYLRYLLGRFDKLETALAAYNAGEGKVGAWLSDAKYSTDGESLDVIPYPETAEYVRRVLAAYKQND